LFKIHAVTFYIKNNKEFKMTHQELLVEGELKEKVMIEAQEGMKLLIMNKLRSAEIYK
jgi:hypothetical protein